MSTFAAVVIAQASIDTTADTLDPLGFGFNQASFTVLAANQSYSIELDPENQVADGQIQYVIAVRGIAQPAYIEKNLVAPVNGMSIDLGAALVGAVIQITAMRTGTPVIVA